jgi:hypothetical protein
MKNFADGGRGHLFQGRFGSCVLDETHLIAAARYVELNPVNLCGANLRAATCEISRNNAKACRLKARAGLVLRARRQRCLSRFRNCENMASVIKMTKDGRTGSFR